LVWEDQREAVEDRMDSELPVLTGDPARAIGTDSAHPHVLIEGDNLHALACLRYSHLGSVDAIYIDPPYNTGKEFRYNDKLVGEEDEWRHSKWLSFMHRRLLLAQELLRDTGVVLISIDDNEQAHLKLLCDQVFGPRNFVAQLVWQGGRKNDSRFISVGHDYILIYARNRQALLDANVRWRERKSGMDDILSAGADIWARSGGDADAATVALKAWFRQLPAGHPARAHKHYNRICERAGRVFFPADISWPGGGGPTYPVLHPLTGEPCRVPSGGWRYPAPERMLEMREMGRICFGIDHKTVPTRKSFLEEIDSEVPQSVFDRDRRAANKELASLLGKSKFQFPKNVDVLARWLKIVTGKDAVILDFFAGSGSTGHAVAALNAADGGTRQVILVTNNENGICDEVTWPRLRNVLTGAWAGGPHEPLPGSLRYFRCDFVPVSRNRDMMLRRLSGRAADLIGLREGAFDRDVDLPGRYQVLHGGSRRVVVWCDWNTEDLDSVLAEHGGTGVERVLYLFSFDDTPDPSVVAAHPDWRVEALPEPLLIALRKAHRRSSR
jgi:16S rRNA G966 N2-methylase RsmD